jgi:hypothetical protein
VKISRARLDEAQELRATALRILDRSGLDTILYDPQKRHHTRQAEIGGLTIMHSSPQGEQLLDIWQDRKVFSIAWDATGAIQVVSFRPGNWREILRASAKSQ